MKKNNLLLIILSIFLISIIGLSWILPGGIFEKSGELGYRYQKINPAQKPLFGTLFTVLWEGCKEASPIIFFIFLILLLVELLQENSSFSYLLHNLYHHFRKKPKQFITYLVWLFGIGGTTFGLAEESIVFYPIIITLMGLLGYPKEFSFTLIFLSCGIGVMFSTINPFATGIATNIANISLASGLMNRIIVWVISMVYVNIWMLHLEKKIPKKQIPEFVPTIDSQKTSKKLQYCVHIFYSSFIILIIGVIPWHAQFNINVFITLHHFITSLFPFWQNVAPLGSWWFNEMNYFYAIIVILIFSLKPLSWGKTKAILKVTAKTTISIASVIILARSLSIALKQTNLQGSLLYYSQKNLSGFSLVEALFILFIFFCLLSFFITSTSGLASFSLPILVPLTASLGIAENTLINLYQGAQGWINLITPSFPLVLTALNLANISYKQWIKILFPKGLGLIVILMLSILFPVFPN